ncbi:MAG: S8 family serine peptidase [Phycisphaerae bacterium]|nr:S8 family serine peptidase [Phycisphaerae bacterium]
MCGYRTRLRAARWGAFSRTTLLSRAARRAASTAILAPLLMAQSCTPAAPGGADPTVVQDQVIVVTKPGTTESRLNQLVADSGAEVQGQLAGLSAYLLQFTADRRSQVESTLGSSPLVEEVVDNHYHETQPLPGDPLVGEQWFLPAVRAAGAWEVTTGNPNIIAAILDSGVQTSHPDLASKLTGGANTYDGSGWEDTTGHGTAVAGIIGAASDSSEGISSLAWQNPILPIKVTNDRGQTTSWALAAGINLAVQQHARVINISFDTLHDDPIVLRQARQARLAGTLVVIAAGNSGRTVTGSASSGQDALFIGATNKRDELASFSTTGSFVNLAAPGVDILTTSLGSTYGTFTGTSFSAPIVSGIAALIWSVRPTLTPSTVQAILIATAVDLGSPGWDDRYGAGRVDAQAALELAQQVVEQSDQTPPSVQITSPSSALRVTGGVTVEVSASDTDMVADLSLLVDDVVMAVDLSPPYKFYLDTSAYAAGAHRLKAVAADVSGNTAEHEISLVFATSADVVPPTVTISSPVQGATLRGLTTILARAMDDRSVGTADILVDDHIIAHLTLPPSTESTVAYNLSPPSAGMTPGTHRITVQVCDLAGNQASASVSVTVSP